jgi:hypothetical protein
MRMEKRLSRFEAYVEIMVEYDGYAFFVEVVYEKILNYYTHSPTIGHFVNLCNKLHSKTRKNVSKLIQRCP